MLYPNFILLNKIKEIQDLRNTMSLDSPLCDEMGSLYSLLCHEPEEPSLDSFAYNENDTFLKSLKTIEILPSLTSILSDFNKLTLHTPSCTQSYNVWGNTGRAHFKPSLFSKSLAAKVKMESYKRLKLQQVRKLLKLHEPHSWYSVNLLFSFAFHNFFG